MTIVYKQSLAGAGAALQGSLQLVSALPQENRESESCRGTGVPLTNRSGNDLGPAEPLPSIRHKAHLDCLPQTLDRKALCKANIQVQGWHGQNPD